MVVATWNLGNLFRPGGEFGPRTEVAYRGKLDALAAVLREVAPGCPRRPGGRRPGGARRPARRAGGTWHVQLSDHPDDRGIGVGFASRLPFEHVTRFAAFPRLMAPIQVDDAGGTAEEMGRGGMIVRTGGVDLLTCHLKSKLLTFGPGRFQPRDAGERGRFAAYARRPQRRAGGPDDPAAAGTARLGDRHRRRRPAG